MGSRSTTTGGPPCRCRAVCTTSEYAVEVYVDYYTKVEYDPAADAIMEVLSTTENIGVSYEGAELEEDTNLIHHSWACEVL